MNQTKTRIGLVLLATGAVAMSAMPEASAADAYMGGLFGTTPGYNTIIGPNGERINTGWTLFGGDERISWNNIGQSSAERAQIKWLESHQGEQNTLWVYSATANSINAVINSRPDLFVNTTVIAIAPPKAGSAGYQQVSAPSTAKVYQVIVDGDSVADEDGTSFGTHTDGYRNLNLQTATPISSTMLGGTNTKRSYYQRPGTTTVTPKPKFNLFDIRTWFVPKAKTTVTVPISTPEPEISTLSRESNEQTELRNRSDSNSDISKSEEADGTRRAGSPGNRSEAEGKRTVGDRSARRDEQDSASENRRETGVASPVDNETSRDDSASDSPDSE